MATKINISIPQPCQENWQAMTPTEKGRFCASCQKNVFDFTTASDRQIIEAYNKNKNLCGRFISSQLNRDLVAPKEQSSIWIATTSAIISFLSIGSHTVFAQETIKTEQTDKKGITEKSDATTFIQEREITGVVSDEAGALPSANVVVKGTLRGTQTDIDGKFSINAKEGEILVFSYIGMKEQESIIDKLIKYDIKMIEDKSIPDVVILAGGIKRRTFLGRVFHKIKK